MPSLQCLFLFSDLIIDVVISALSAGGSQGRTKIVSLIFVSRLPAWSFIETTLSGEFCLLVSTSFQSEQYYDKTLPCGIVAL